MTDDPRPEDPTPAAPEPARKGILGASAVMASGTLVSRILGALRVFVAALILWPKSQQGDMFAFALMIPNSVYVIVGTGLVNAILVPQIVRAMKSDEDQGAAFINRIVTAFLLIIAAITALCVVAAPALVALFSGDAWQAAELAPQYASMVRLTAFCVPQVFVYGLYIVFGQVLMSRDVFGPYMWAPVANNAVQLATLGLYALLFGPGSLEHNSLPFTLPESLTLAGGWALALIVQFSILLPFLRRAGIRYRPRFDFLHTGLGKTFTLAKWSLAFVVVTEIQVFVLAYLLMDATTGGEGAGKSVYDTANLIFAMPHSIIAVSIATALVPVLSRLAAAGAKEEFAGELMGGVKLTITVLLPVSLLFVVLGKPIPEAFYRLGQGGDLIGYTLMAMALGLVPYSLYYVFQRAYFALEELKPVFYTEVVAAVAAIALAFAFVRGLAPGPEWIAPAVGLAQFLSCFACLAAIMVHMRRRIPEFRFGPMYGQLGRVFLASVPGTALAGALVWFQTTHWESFLADFLGLVAGLLAAIAVYLGMARLLRLKEVGQVLGLVIRRKPSTDE